MTRRSDGPAGPPEAAFSEVVRLARIDSTNRYASDAAATGAAHGLVVLTDEQTAGRGRLGRSWVAPAGSSLLCSVLFRTRLALASLHLLPSVVALAALDSADELVGYGAAIKWPNDLVAGRRKLAGVLAEIVPGSPPAPGAAGAPAAGAATGPGVERAVVVGIGLNVAWPPGFPPEAPDADAELARLARTSTTLAELAGHVVDREQVVAVFLAALRRRYGQLLEDGGEETLRAYRRRCSTIGRDVRVLLRDGEVSGAAVDVTEDGRLLVVTDGDLRAFDAGDVVHVR